MDYTSIILAISAAILSGMGTAIVSGIRENRREKIGRMKESKTTLN